VHLSQKLNNCCYVCEDVPGAQSDDNSSSPQLLPISYILDHKWRSMTYCYWWWHLFCDLRCQLLRVRPSWLCLTYGLLPGSIPTTNYLIEKLFRSDSRAVDVHYSCADADCMIYFGLHVPATCDKYETVYKGNLKKCEFLDMCYLFLISCNLH